MSSPDKRCIFVSMKIVVREHSKLPADKVTCACCGKKIADIVGDDMIPDFQTCYKNGNIPVPNFGWLCSMDCAEKLEKDCDIQFLRTKKGKIDYYEGEIK